MSNPCNINDSKRDMSIDPRNAIEIVGGDSITVFKEELSDKTRYTINYREYAAPTINSNTGVFKVGTEVTFEFNANIVSGSEEIIARTMTPDKGLNLEQPMTWTETNVHGISEGLWPRFPTVPTKITAMDSKGTSVSKDIGIEFRYLMYSGYSDLEFLTQADVKALASTGGYSGLDNSIFDNHRVKVYTAPDPLKLNYIYWVYPIGTPTILEAERGPTSVPIFKEHPTVTVVDSGISKDYRVIRTANKSSINKANINLK